MGKTQKAGDNTTVAAATGAPTSSTIGVELEALVSVGMMKPALWLITAVVSGGATDLTLWGCVPEGAAGDETDDLWGVVNDKFGNIKKGVLGTALAVGTYHWIVSDLGVFSRLYFQNSANAVSVHVKPVLFSMRGT